MNPKNSPKDANGKPKGTRWIHTIGNQDQIEENLKGIFLDGNREPRFAMVGRSNVGKSSLINALLKKKLAQVSASPGKTRLIHFYLWEEAKKILVDLPGYGFAKVSKEERDRWAGFVTRYLEWDQALERCFVLWDGRHGPTENDLEAFEFLRSMDLEISIVMTKFDDVKTQSDRVRRKREVEAVALKYGISTDEVFWVSAKAGTGVGELVNRLKKEKAKEKKS